MLAQLGYDVTGVDLSETGIAQARAAFPALSFHRGSVYDDLVPALGTFDVVVSLEVIEHLYAPRDYVRSLLGLLREGGTAILSTPYHGYLKNLAIALAGRFDAHVSPLWDGGAHQVLVDRFAPRTSARKRHPRPRIRSRRKSPPLREVDAGGLQEAGPSGNLGMSLSASSGRSCRLRPAGRITAS